MEQLEIIYVAGPMTGLPEYNIPTFTRIANKLREAGHIVLCPTENGVDQAEEWLVHMKADLIMLLQANAIALLPGWAQSKGATLELFIARFLGYTTYIIDSKEELMPAKFPKPEVPV